MKFSENDNWKYLIPIGNKITGLDYKEYNELGRNLEWWKAFCVALVDTNLTMEESDELKRLVKVIEKPNDVYKEVQDWVEKNVECG